MGSALFLEPFPYGLDSRAWPAYIVRIWRAEGAKISLVITSLYRLVNRFYLGDELHDGIDSVAHFISHFRRLKWIEIVKSCFDLISHLFLRTDSL